MASPAPQVVLMSATISCKEFADYFAVPVQNELNPACVYEVEGEPYAVEECYLDDLEHLHRGRVRGKASLPAREAREHPRGGPGLRSLAPSALF